MTETLARTGWRNLSWHTIGVLILASPSLIAGRLTWTVLAGAILYNVTRWILHLPHDRIWFWYWRRMDRKGKATKEGQP